MKRRRRFRIVGLSFEKGEYGEYALYPRSALFVTPFSPSISKKNFKYLENQNFGLKNNGTASNMKSVRNTFWLLFTLPLLIACRSSSGPDAPAVAPSFPPQHIFDSLFSALRYDTVLILAPALEAHFADQKDWSNYYAVCHKTAVSLWRVHRSDSAVALVQRLLPEATRYLGAEHALLAEFHTTLGNIHADRRTERDFRIACEHFQAALNINRKLFGEPSPEVAACYERFGIAHWLVDDYPEALAQYDRALGGMGRIKAQNGLLAARIYLNTGLLFFDMGQYRRALQRFTDAHHILSDTLHRRDSKVAKCLHNMAKCQLQLGDTDQALALAHEALLLEGRVGSPGSKLHCYIQETMAACQMAQGNYDTAIAIYQQCLPYWQPDNRDDLNGLVVEHQNLAEAYLKKGQPDEALRHLRKSFVLMDTAFDAGSFQRVGVLKRMGEAYLVKKDARAAEIFLKKALAIALPKVGEQHPVVGRLRRKISEVYAMTGAWGRAMQEAEAARVSFYSKGSPCGTNSLPDFIELHDWMGLLQHHRPAAKDSAAFFYRQAIAYADSLQRTLTSKTARQELQTQVFSIADHALAHLHRQWLSDPRSDQVREAFFFMEKSKSAGLLASIRELEARQSARIPAVWLDQEQQIKARVAYLQNQLHPAAPRENLPILGPQQKAQWQQALLAARCSLDSFLLALEQRFPDYYQLKYAGPVADLSAVRQYAGNQNACIVEFFYGDEAIYALSASTDTVLFQKITDRAILETALNGLHQGLRHPDATHQSDSERLAEFQFFCQNARTLYHDLLAPVIDAPARKTTTRPEKLILIPDGPLCYLPFHILLSGQPEAAAGAPDYRHLPYLLRQFSVQYESAATILLHSASRNSQPVGGYLGFAPDYTTGASLAARDENTTSLWADADRGTFGQLLHNQLEIRTAARLMNGTCLFGSAASETRFKERAGHAGILHLAMHGLVNHRESDQSALVFSSSAPLRSPPQDDGLLHAWELYDLRLSARLAVLSACHTGAGRWQRGEGAMSLSRAFRYAGCPSVVMSLWAADDASAATMVTGFFEHLKLGEDKSVALRAAALQYLAKEQCEAHCHPYFWANLVLTGDDSAVLFSEKKVAGAWVLLWVAMSLVIGLCYYFNASNTTRASA